MNLILFGFKGSGKTYFGTRLAKELARPFVDSDDLMIQIYAEESGQRLSVQSLYQTLGEIGFRSLETKAIATLKHVKNSVIALGGGAVISSINLKILQQVGQLVYLETSLDTIKRRVHNFLVGPLEKTYFERLPIYQSIPCHRINTDLLDERGVLAAFYSLINLENSHGF